MINPHKLYRLNIIFIILFLFMNVFSVSGQNYKHEFSARADNDVYIAFLQDRYYTNGTFINYRFAPELKAIRANTNLEKITVDLELGQKIFTPYYAKAPDPALHDRPFTGYLYAAGTFNKFYKNENMLSLRVEAGTIGEAAKGKEVQVGFHKTFGIFLPQGWEYQLKTEPGLNLALNYQNLMLRSNNEKIDVTLLSAAMLGNTFSGANLGMMFRIGKMNPLYRSISNNSLVSSNANQVKSKEFFLFTSPRINYVAYDATIQGGLFRKDKGPVTFDAKKVVYSQQLGIGFSSPRWSAGYTVNFIGREVESSAKPYHYASISLVYRFNLN